LNVVQAVRPAQKQSEELDEEHHQHDVAGDNDP
jgi:hypothetical protein